MTRWFVDAELSTYTASEEWSAQMSAAVITESTGPGKSWCA